MMVWLWFIYFHCRIFHCIYLFIQANANEHLGWFHVWTITINAAINFYQSVLGHICTSLSRYKSRKGLLGNSVYMHMFNSTRNSKTKICITVTWYSQTLVFTATSRKTVKSHTGFNLHFPDS